MDGTTINITSRHLNSNASGTIALKRIINKSSEYKIKPTNLPYLISPPCIHTIMLVFKSLAYQNCQESAIKACPSCSNLNLSYSQQKQKFRPKGYKKKIRLSLLSISQKQL